MEISNTRWPLLDLPRELQNDIGLFCDGSTLDSLTKTSRECRNIFARTLFREVKFEGQERENSGSLKYFLGKNKCRNLIDITQFIQSARFRADQYFFDGKYLTDCVVLFSWRFHRSIFAMKNLRNLTIDLRWLCDYSNTFAKIRPADNQHYNQVTRLEILTVDPELSSEIIRFFDPCNLKELHVRSKISSHARLLTTNHQLTKLSFDIPGTVWGRDGPEYLTSQEFFNFLSKAADNFKDLEYLDLGDGGWCYVSSFNNAIPRFENTIREIIDRLKRFANLKGLALSMNESDLEPLYVPADSFVSNFRIQTHNRYAKEADALYNSLVHRIGDSLPNIREVVILRKLSRETRGSRLIAGTPLDVQIVSSSGRPFPFGFGKYTEP